MSLEVNFNAFKHHAKFLSQFLSENNKETIDEVMSKIGQSVTDIYYGDLLVDEIKNQIHEYLERNKIQSVDDYSAFIKEGKKKEYKSVILSDDSLWILRLGRDVKTIVHIHPGRYSKYAMRVKGITLQTLISLLATKKEEDLTIECINSIRASLGYPPIITIDLPRYSYLVNQIFK